MDQGSINKLIFCSCLLGFAIGYWLLRWARHEMKALAGEHHKLFKRRLGLWGRQIHARALFAGAIVILWFSATALLNLLFRR
jgi:hypothetical protein